MNRFIVETLFLENYGAHSGDGKASSGNACWKFKGGSRYLVQGEGLTRGNAMAYIMAKHGQNDLHGKEFPIGYHPYEEFMAKRDAEYEALKAKAEIIKTQPDTEEREHQLACLRQTWEAVTHLHEIDAEYTL